MTKDSVPFVGRVPGLEGQFVSAGHCGCVLSPLQMALTQLADPLPAPFSHGMARIFTASPALARMVLNPSMTYAETGLPGAFEITAERVASLKDKPRPGRNMVLGRVERAKL
jgi:hypothetical protein